MGKTIVVALGGNAILRSGQRGTREEQYANLEQACAHLLPLVREGHRIVLTHGNGPQVGNLLIQQVEAADYAPMMSMDICVGMTQGQIGTLLVQALTNQLREAGIQRDVVTLVSHFLIDPGDPDFNTLSKPVGPFLDERLKRRYEALPGHVIREIGKDPARPFRRVVASPRPLRLIEKRALRALSEAGVIVITAGGGGIPVMIERDGTMRSIEAVIDKDLAAEKIAESIAADVLLILTDVEGVALYYGTPKQRFLHDVTLDEARAYYAEGHFASGSMSPKVLACMQFLEYGGDAAIIGGLASAAQAISGKAGTRFVKR